MLIKKVNVSSRRKLQKTQPNRIWIFSVESVEESIAVSGMRLLMNFLSAAFISSFYKIRRERRLFTRINMEKNLAGKRK
jgi:hypothetical protein